ncbi:hypothetical protein OAB57_02500 [Bacteriovoracaceae bacterium]|nr:hypothetical protein [Bacteriovoracaceae bacterium]
MKNKFNSTIYIAFRSLSLVATLLVSSIGHSNTDQNFDLLLQKALEQTADTRNDLELDPEFKQLGERAQQQRQSGKSVGSPNFATFGDVVDAAVQQKQGRVSKARDYVQRFLRNRLEKDLFTQASSYAKDVVAVKANQKGGTDHYWKDLMAKQYKHLGLMDEEGNWMSSELKGIADKLLPNVNQDQVDKFIDTIAGNMRDNKCLKELAQTIKPSEYKDFVASVKKQANRFLPREVAYAMALENLTREQLKDVQVVKSTQKIFDKYLEEKNIGYNTLGAFGTAKLFTVNRPVYSMIKFIEEYQAKKQRQANGGNISNEELIEVSNPDFLQLELPANIAEAILTESVLSPGMHGARACGRTLARNTPGRNTFSSKTGAGPAQIVEVIDENGESHGLVEINVALAQKWVELYQLWNTGFLTSFEEGAANYFPKLWIPSVGSAKLPGNQYINARAYALRTHIQYTAVRIRDIEDNGVEKFNLRDQKIVQAFSDANGRCAEKYEQALEEATGNRKSNWFVQNMKVAGSWMLPKWASNW